MSQGNPSCLRFSLEESVWFQKGQEVSELISISLDPDILIQENDQYVTIQGALELSGEYKRHETDAFENQHSFTAPKFIQVVEERDEGVCEFSHFFPVDITIPNNRIHSVHDIDVSVESFDYVFPERSCMKLTANLMISGLYGEQHHTPSAEEAVQNEYEPAFRSEEFPELNWNIQTDAEQEEAEILAGEDETEEIYIPFEAEARKQPSEPEENERTQAQEIKVEKADVKPNLYFLSHRGEKTSAQEIYQMPKTDESSLEEVKVIVESAEQETVIYEESSSSSADFKEAEKEEKKKKKLLSKKKSMSLTEFFARKAEDNVARLKVCIVQNGDTVDTIAERYDIPVHRLLSVNHLEMHQDIYEGQVLYIPVAVAQK